MFDIDVDELRQNPRQFAMTNVGLSHACASISMGPVGEDGLVVGPGKVEGFVTPWSIRRRRQPLEM
jgi:hypothetical protein